MALLWDEFNSLEIEINRNIGDVLTEIQIELRNLGVSRREEMEILRCFCRGFSGEVCLSAEM